MFDERVSFSIKPGALHVGTAGWSIPRECAANFGDTGPHIERYSQFLPCAEIDSSFYRSHRPGTYAKWAATVPENFLFSVKAPKTITHLSGLAPSRTLFESFFEEIAPLGEKLGPLLFQFPPKQGFEEPRVRAFLTLFRDTYPDGQAAFEPRHASWFCDEANELLAEFRVARVVADPPRAQQAIESAGCAGPVYYRLHGSPRVYYSSYSEERLKELAGKLSNYHPGAAIWCIFDNTASGAALGNALTLIHLLEGQTQDDCGSLRSRTGH